MDEFALADQYLDSGNGKEAMRIFRTLAERGRVDAMHSIAHTHLYGIAGIRRDYTEAFTWFTKAARNGCPQAMYHLGLMNEEGLGIPANPKAALDWYQKSAQRGDEDAEYRVGLCHERGVGTTANIEEAEKWYRLAAAHGQEDAKARLATLSGREPE